MVRNSDPGGAAPAFQIVAPQQITIRTIPSLERQIDEAITTRSAVVDLHLAATQIIDSAGLNWLLNTQSRLGTANIPLRLVEIPALINDILLATRLDHRFFLMQAEAPRNA